MTTNLNLARALFPIFTAVLLATACSDSTGPSKVEPSTDQAAGGAAPKGESAAPESAPPESTAPADSQAPAVAPALGRVSGAVSPTGGAPLSGSSLVRTQSWIDRRYTTQAGSVSIPRGAAFCMGNGRSGIVFVSGMRIVITGGLSALYPQYATAEVWFYRWNGTSWVYEAGAKVGTRNPMDLSAEFPQVQYTVNRGGYYHVQVRFTQYANIAGWVKTAVQTYDFNSQAEYSSLRGTGVGYCTM